jgi:hypothetical protein
MDIKEEAFKTKASQMRRSIFALVHGIQVIDKVDFLWYTSW